MLAKQDSNTDEEETSGIEHKHSPNQSLTVRVKADSHTFLTSKSFQNRIKIVVRIVVESSTLTVANDFLLFPPNIKWFEGPFLSQIFHLNGKSVHLVDIMMRTAVLYAYEYLEAFRRLPPHRVIHIGSRGT